ncbi:DNA-directed RNA polymerase subunit L [Candidatus Woesearchaeota archaeon]|nr:DNA-directed RNA polymerase subunit L [Candidatus Woesearchaeota archaeon]
MQINVIEDKKNKLVFEVDGMGHTYLNMLKSELWNDEHVKVATYNIRHMEVSKPKFILETDGNDAKAVLMNAVARLKKGAEKFRKEITASVK